MDAAGKYNARRRRGEHALIRTSKARKEKHARKKGGILTTLRIRLHAAEILASSTVETADCPRGGNKVDGTRPVQLQ